MCSGILVLRCDGPAPPPPLVLGTLHLNDIINQCALPNTHGTLHIPLLTEGQQTEGQPANVPHSGMSLSMSEMKMKSLVKAKHSRTQLIFPSLIRYL